MRLQCQTFRDHAQYKGGYKSGWIVPKKPSNKTKPSPIKVTTFGEHGVLVRIVEAKPPVRQTL